MTYKSRWTECQIVSTQIIWVYSITKTGEKYIYDICDTYVMHGWCLWCITYVIHTLVINSGIGGGGGCIFADLEAEGKGDIFNASLANLLNKFHKNAVFWKTIELGNIKYDPEGNYLSYTLEVGVDFFRMFKGGGGGGV